MLDRSARMSRLQHDEHMYYVPCYLCHRSIAVIELYGCTQCAHAPAPEAVLARRLEYERQVRRAKELEILENRGIREGSGAVFSSDTNRREGG